MIQDRNGYVWLATQEGLARFDGLRFTLFSRASHPQIAFNYIRVLLEDRSGRIWAGTNEGGLFRIEPDGTVIARPDRLPGDLRCLFEDQSGRIWIGLAKGGIACLSGEALQTWGPAEGFPGEQALAMALDDQGRLLVGTDKGVFFGRPPFDPWPGNRLLPSPDVTSLLAGSGRELWVGTRGGLLHWKPDRSRIFDKIRDLGFDWIWCLLGDRNGSIWVGSNGGGLARIIDEEVRERLTIENGLHDNAIWSMLEDREGGLWLGGNGGGLARYRPGLFSNLGSGAGAGNGPYSAVCEADDGALWIGTWWDGCYVVTPGKIRHLTTADGLPDNNISSLCSDGRGGMWVGTDNGGIVLLARDAPPMVVDARDGLAHNEVYALARGLNDTLWVGSLGGIQRLSGRNRFSDIPGLAGIGARCLLALPDGTIWIGSEGRGLGRLRNGELQFWTKKEGLPSDKIFALHPDGDGGLWIGTQGGGLSHLDESGRLFADALPQLSGSPVFQILEDDRKGLWLSGNRGLTVLEPEDVGRLKSHRPLDGPARLVGLAEGMASEECTGGFQPAGCRTRDGRLCWPTLRSVAVFDPARQIKNSRPPILVIEEIRGDGREFRPRTGNAFPAGTRSIAIRYAAVGHNSPQRISCRFRLEGFDPDWHQADPPVSRLITYTNLPPGNYRLRIEAANEDGIKSEGFAGLEFSVRPFIHQTLLFKILAVLAFIPASYFLVNGLRRYLFLLAFWRKERVVGAYVLERPLGSGGSARVYRARHLLIRSRVVALKLLREDLARDPVQSRRFSREAALIDRCNHPGIVRIIERGSHRNTSYIAMEYLEGVTLDEKIKSGGGLHIPAVLDILSQAASALAFLHDRDVVHRDLKPRNIMLVGKDGERPTVKLLDFGIAKIPDGTVVTQTDIVLGTLAYLAPEHVQTGQGEAAGDIYALGVVAYEMVTGRLPYAAGSGATLMREIVSLVPTPPRDKRTDCPPGLNDLILEMLAKEPRRRPTARTLQERSQILKNDVF